MRSVLILGSGGLSIGQAGEFDYSGSQAIKALKEEGIRTILINPNIATIQTSDGLADQVYFIPITLPFVTEVIEKERPDGILLSFGGQTALNCGIALHKQGILSANNVSIIGTPIETVIATEDRGLFIAKLDEIGVKTAKSTAVKTIAEGIFAAQTIGYPLIIRAGYALGGLGSGFANNEQELRHLLEHALSASDHALVEESLKGWKEVEYEVMRDSQGNCMIICNMENLDPLGIHTGESIVVAPSQTLTDEEYHGLRRISIDTVNHLGIIGECNIQFAENPKTHDYRVIEVNARLSRSSALASKATGYPIAFIAAKLGLGKSLLELKNPITGKTSAFFEPALDYIVVKFPRWDLNKFRYAEAEIGSSMKSVGEAMAIGRTFEEALQKAVRMIHHRSLTEPYNIQETEFIRSLTIPTDKRIFAITTALQSGMSIEDIHKKTNIDPWFLQKIKNIVSIIPDLNTLTPATLSQAKKLGYADIEIARHANLSESDIRSFRKKHDINPRIKQIDTLAGEYPAETNYLYLTYHGDTDDIQIKDKGIIVLGSGPYSIGSSVEFDWCSVTCAKTIRAQGKKAIIINHNPETVSTDYDECDRLYFEELTYERVLDIIEKENPEGVIVSMGGQIPNNLALPLSQAGAPILGTPPRIIDQVEDRHAFSSFLAQINADQPAWKELTTIDEAKTFASTVGYPVLIRPSFVLSGSAMAVAYGPDDLALYLNRATAVSKSKPVVVTKFIENAKEIDMDLVCQDGVVKAYAISEHVENAGVHSGDATLVTPAQKLYVETLNRIKRISKSIVKELRLTGPVNIQFLAKDNQIKIIECNLRASRSFPFVSKVYGINFIELATLAILGNPIEKIPSTAFDLDYLGVKAPQFSFTRLRGADPVLGVEMTSTGEVAALGETREEAFLKALLATGFRLPKKNILISTGDIQNKTKLLPSIRTLSSLGYTIYATPGTHTFYASQGISLHLLHWPLDDATPNVKEYLTQGKIDLVINIPKNNEPRELSNDYKIRRAAADFSIPLITNAQCAELFTEALEKNEPLHTKSWKEYLNG